uniref:Vitronectin-like n=1 Tax=Petromyzon marinus TaxID=7757 RepID=A0AAJ7XJL9_PETMA|nr:vitronectin-like [Petromyzon marinus]
MTTPNGSVLAFRGLYVWELFPVSGGSPSQPRLIEEAWGVPPPVDAAFTRINCQALSYIFKGDKYWRFTDGVLDRGFPRSLSRGFPRVPAAPDAAFAAPRSGRAQEHAYFFKGGQYYKYTFRQQLTSRECRRLPRSRAPHSGHSHGAPHSGHSHGAPRSGHSHGAPYGWDAFMSRFFSARHDQCYPRDTALSWRGVPTRLDGAMLSPYPAHPHAGLDVYFYSRGEVVERVV